MFGKRATNEKGAIPVILLIILAGTAILGAGTILLIVAFVNITGVIRWVKELKREIKGKEIKNEEQ
jgi:ABC-type dipeptide/oligopeptide/nickel transport system permease subunit